MQDRCPGCGAPIDLPTGAGPGYRWECTTCADLTLELRAEAGRLVVRTVAKAWCPDCDRVVELPAEAVDGSLFRCTGRTYRVLHQWGAVRLVPHP
jgi:hypothetical protein